MQSSLFQSFFSIFGFNQEKKRIDSEWEEATEQMRIDTESIKKFREEYEDKLNAARQKLMQGKEAMRVRLSQDSFMVEIKNGGDGHE